MKVLTITLHRLAHLSQEQFQDYWSATHAPLVVSFAETLGIKRYVQLHTIERPSQAPVCDGLAEVWYDSIEAFEAVLSSPVARAPLRALAEDESRFIDTSRSRRWWSNPTCVL